ncbi:hypothetical protein AVEN_150884-1 [Araneus ventricosus]|uniref:Ciliary microtubule inner protein 2A-C-like domain-containing protein n=1 Tax=Araneus ventricosus TaxID=182803 RepID=A0A4Y2C975_ARAVE|nr:hypothetical protein AVEN_150884-1 [Araneus ventricosus]
MMLSVTSSKSKKSGTLPFCTKPIQGEIIRKNFQNAKCDENIGQNILLESLSKNCPDYDSQNKKNHEMESQDLCYLCMHEMTSKSPIRRHYVVPGYTGYIPGKIFSCGERFTAECKKCTERFLRRRILSEEHTQRLTQNLAELPSYFEVWYELPRGRIQNDMKCC